MTCWEVFFIKKEELYHKKKKKKQIIACIQLGSLLELCDVWCPELHSHPVKLRNGFFPTKTFSL